MIMLKNLIILIIIVPLLSFKSTIKTDKPLPNIILIMADDVGYGDLEIYGNPIVKTPHINQLYHESVSFSEFHVAPMCTPSRSQLFTGVHCVANAANNVSSGRALLRTDLPAIPELLENKGYATGIFGKWHLGDNYPYRPQDRGFQETLWFPSSHIGSIPDAWNNDYINDRYNQNGQLKQFRGYCTDVFFEEAINWMKKQQTSSKPFFTYLPLNAAHAPYIVPEKYRSPYIKKLGHIKSDKNKHEIASFLGMISNIDENIGKLMRFLNHSGLEKNTVIIFLSDNGTAKGEKVFNAGMRGIKGSLYEGGHRVPLLIKFPDHHNISPQEIKANTQIQDLFPTLLDLATVEAKENHQLMEGISLLDLIIGNSEKFEDRMSVIQFSPFIWFVDPKHTTNPKKGDAAILYKNWRLVRGTELYHLEDDPLQQKNVLDTYPAVVKEMKFFYDQWWDKNSTGSEQFLPNYIGGNQDTVQLTSTDWADTFMDKSIDVRAGANRNGPWNLEVQSPGTYRFELRRWPREANMALTDATPPHTGEEVDYPEGKALPIASARMQIADFDKTIDVQNKDQKAVFEVKLAKGKTWLQTWFYDKDNQALAGAYYVDILKIKTTDQ